MARSNRQRNSGVARKRRLRARTLSCALLFAMAACSDDTGLRAFSSDGCSLFPDSSLISESDWCDCCFQHDIAYWQGGTRAERESADGLLRDCVLDKTGNSVLAGSMYEGVRLGGSPHFYSWYRWGYGWPYGRKYEALTSVEKNEAEVLLEAYFSQNGPQVCK